MPKHVSRAKRFEDAQAQVSDAKSVFEELRDELQSWRDNLPENLQSSQKADDLDNCISELETAISSAEEIEGTSPEFPGMY